MKTYHIKIEKDPESDWFVVQCVEHPGAISQGKTIDECMNNIREALDLLLEDTSSKLTKESKFVLEIPAALA